MSTLRSTRILVALIAVALLAGCAGLGYNGMKADEINASVKDKSSAFVCTEVFGPWGKGTSFVANIDKTPGTGGGELSGKCGGSEFSYKDAGRAAPVPHQPAAGTPAAVRAGTETATTAKP